MKNEQQCNLLEHSFHVFIGEVHLGNLLFWLRLDSLLGHQGTLPKKKLQKRDVLPTKIR